MIQFGFFITMFEHFKKHIGLVWFGFVDDELVLTNSIHDSPSVYNYSVVSLCVQRTYS